MTNGTLALLGSGETSSQGRKIHDYLMAAIGAVPVRVAMLETPAGFQPNVHAVYQKVGEFLEKSLQNYHPHIEYVQAHRKETVRESVKPAQPSAEEPLREADYIFSGPGSPTYAARNLQGTRAFDLLAEAYRRGATLVLSSAAAVAVGSSVLRVYEIFKAGADLGWDDGLHFMRRVGLGIDPVIVPHWNNAEGGASLDTSRCFMGRQRFDRLVEMLPPVRSILGIDEHTACILEGRGVSFRVMGAGTATVINNGKTTVISAGETFPLAMLQTPLAA
ncbi:MAG TPA: cysteinyl-tRNA synthetase [Chloroflexia bacterium]|nr:cysteinyl-tRNA synthetase [Chloroflexia bacterium]